MKEFLPIILFLIVYTIICINIIYKQINIIKDIKTCNIKLKAAIIDYRVWPGRPTKYIFDIAFRYKGETLKGKLISIDSKIKKLSKDKIIDILYVEGKDKIYWAHESLFWYVVPVVAISILFIYTALMLIICTIINL